MAENGAKIAAATEGCDAHVVQLFALFHDSRRENDDQDPMHWFRAAAFAIRLPKIPLSHSMPPGNLVAYTLDDAEDHTLNTLVVMFEERSQDESVSIRIQAFSDTIEFYPNEPNEHSNVETITLQDSGAVCRGGIQTQNIHVAILGEILRIALTGKGFTVVPATDPYF